MNARIASTARWLIILLVMLAWHLPSTFALSPQTETESPPGKPEAPPGEARKRVNPSLPRIVIEGQSASPATTVVIPLYQTPPQGTEMRTLSVELEWVSKNVKFVRLERGVVAEAIGADVKGTVTGTTKDANSLEHTTLRIDASVTDDNPTHGFTDGLLAYLTFRISDEAQAFAVELRPKLLSAETIGSPGKKFTQAEVEAGKITVDLPGLPPYVTCFFFSH